MVIDPLSLRHNLERLEDIEKASLRLVTQAIYDYREAAEEIFYQESDLAADIGEDITREALDKLGMSKIDQRLFGKVDYKRARYLFHPEYTIKQALFVDSKAEKTAGQGTATLQTSQFSMMVRQQRAGHELEVAGAIPAILRIRDEDYITTTIFVKYNYVEQESQKELKTITVAALPNGLLQAQYNPDSRQTIWVIGRNAPSRGETFRVRLSFARLRAIAPWRVQSMPLHPQEFFWRDG